MNYICTWLCVDEQGEESRFPQTGQLSSSQSHQDIYWRCLLLFFITSKRFNKSEKHLLFTNAKKIPVVDGRNLSRLLEELGVAVICTDFKYKTPKGYYGAFQNQFYEFSILEYITKNSDRPNDQYLIVDSDCLFLKPAAPMFATAAQTGFLSFEDEVKPDYVINGLSRNDLKVLYEELMGTYISETPSYHLGEFFLCSAANINKLFADFEVLWPQLLARHAAGVKKFNEEAHTLSYLYFKNGFQASNHTHFMRRIWTNPLFYREVRNSDMDLTIWHLPAEKTFGLDGLYRIFMSANNYGFDFSHEKYIETVTKTVGVPHLSLSMKMKYYTVSYYRAIRKRLKQPMRKPVY